MADFLSRLVERSAGTAPVARPVVAPLFGPGPAITADPAPEGPDHVGVLPQDPASVAVPIPRELTSIPRDAAAVDPAALRRIRGPARPATPTSQEAAPGALRPAAAPPPEPPHAAVLDEDRRQRGEGVPVAAPPSPPGARNLTAVPRRSAASQDSSREEARNPAVTTPLLRPRKEDAPRWAEAAQLRGAGDESSPPIVRISIGRIEVRAVAPPGPAAPRPMPAGKRTGLSLEEYLKPRGRGR
jgi:hypothetical protein